MALLQIVTLMLAVQYAYGQCVVPEIFQQSVGVQFANSGQQLTITFCPNRNTPGALGVHTCQGSSWFPAIACQAGGGGGGVCPIPGYLQQFVRQSTIPTGYSLVVTRCVNGPAGYSGRHRCGINGQFIPQIPCYQAPQPTFRPVRPQQSGGFNLGTLLLLSSLGGGNGFSLCSLFPNLGSCGNSTSSGRRKKRYVELEEMNLNEKHESKGRGSWEW